MQQREDQTVWLKLRVWLEISSPHCNTAEKRKLILTAYHVLFQAKFPFFQALSMTIPLSGTEHSPLPAPDRLLLKHRCLIQHPFNSVLSRMTDLQRWGIGQARPCRWRGMAGAEISATKVSPNRHPLSWALLWHYLRGSKTLSEQLMCCFSFYILCLNAGITVPKENRDWARKNPPLSPTSSSSWSLGLQSKKLTNVKTLVRGWDTLWGKEALGLVHKHWHFCYTQCSMMPDSEPSSQKAYKLGDFWKYFLNIILLLLCKETAWFFSGLCSVYVGVPSSKPSLIQWNWRLLYPLGRGQEKLRIKQLSHLGGPIKALFF